MAVARVPPLASGHALATARDHGRAREGDEGGNGRATEGHGAAGAKGEQRKRPSAIKTLSSIVIPWGNSDERQRGGFESGRCFQEDGGDAC